jgi:hypothetical protein
MDEALAFGTTYTPRSDSKVANANPCAIGANGIFSSVWRTSGDDQARRIASREPRMVASDYETRSDLNEGDIVDSVMPCVPGGCICQGDSVGPNCDWNSLHAVLVSWGYG